MRGHYIKPNKSDLSDVVGLYQFNVKTSIMKKIIAWVLLSSKDPNKVSLTVKGVLTGAVVWIVWWGGLFGLHFDPESLGQIVEVVSTVVQLALTLGSMVATLWGLLRKIWKTAKGTNEVLNQY